MSKGSDVTPPPTSSGEGLRRRRGRDFDEVDARIAIPVAAGRQLLQSGISKYRSLSGRALVVPGAALNAPPPAPDEPPFPRSSHHKPRKPPHAARDEPPEPSPLERAQRLVAQKQFAAAIPYFSEALSASNSSSSSSSSGNAALQYQSRLRVYFERGSCYLAAQRYQQAIEDFTRVITLTPKNPQLFAKRARAYAQLQQHAAALSDYNEAIALAAEPEPPNSATLRALLLARARVFCAIKDTRSALDDLARAEATGGHRDAELFYERAHVHLERGDERLALQDLDRFLELQTDELAHQDVVDMTGVSAADEALERVQDVRFDRAKLLQKLAAKEDAKFRTDAELVEIEQGVLRSAGGESAKPKQPTRGGGTGYRSAEAVALVLRAIKDYTLLLDVEPATMNVAEILLRRGEAYGHIDRFEDALRDLNRAHELSPSDFDVSIARAKLYQQQGDLQSAIAEMTAVLQLNGFFIDALFFRAKLYAETGDWSKAQRDYTSIIEAHYDVRSESYSDVGASANATEKTPLLSKANGSTSSSSSSSSSKAAASKSSSQATATTAKPVRFLSQYSKKALLLRARLWVQMNKFEEAIADYEQLKVSSANEIDAQMELQDVLEKQAAFIEKERLEAEESLLQSEDQERLEAEAKKAGGGGGGGGGAKKKKKKKGKKKKRPTPSESGYVLLPDEEDEQGLAGAAAAAGVDTGDDDDGEAIEMTVPSSTAASSSKRDELEEDDDDAGVASDDRVGESGDESTNSSGTAGGSVTVREVIVDEKYLRKRQRQLEKLRSDIRGAWESRDRAAIEDMLERAERKQMTDSLGDEIERAKIVLEKLASGAAIDNDDEDDDAAATASAPTNKPPSLVIRPIAYGQALQLAEQSQHQFLQNQRLLQEKDAEIASLRQLLAQSKRQAAIERFDEAENSAELVARVATLRNQFPHKQLRELEHRVESLVNWMGPSDEADHARHKILAFVYRVLEAANIALGTPILVFPTGSFPMKTYLPTADLDVCLLLPKELEQSWHFPVMHALCLAGSANGVGQPQSDTAGGGGGSSLNGSPTPKLGGVGAVGGAGGAVSAGANGFPSNTVRNVNFINADVRVIKCTVDNISVDFTANRTGALGALLLLDSMDARVGKSHLLKKSLILIKAWCIHESGAYTAAVPGSAGQAHTAGASGSPPAGHSVMGSSYGAFSTYAVNTAVMGLFNQYGSKITHPLQALFLFLDRMAEFPWHEAAMTLHGPVALSALASSTSLSTVLKKKRNGRNGGKADVSELHNAKINFEDVEHIRLRTQEQFGAFDASSPNGFKGGMFQIRVCNIVDPLDEKNNLARSVSVDWFPSMKRAFRLGRNRLAALLVSLPEAGSKSGSSKRVDELDDFFENSWKAYGRGDGWRPDLLVHPRQVWHGKPAAAAAAPSDPNEEDLRWQSLLPELVPMAAGPYQQGAMYYPPQYAAHHHHQQQQQQLHHGSHHLHLHQMGSGSPHSAGGGAGLGLTEPMPYQQQQMYHRRSFDSSSKSSPLKSMPSLRHHQQQLSPGPAGAGMNYSVGGMSKSARRYESPTAASQGPVR